MYKEKGVWGHPMSWDTTRAELSVNTPRHSLGSPPRVPGVVIGIRRTEADAEHLAHVHNT
jgi:hypothetical protein